MYRISIFPEGDGTVTLGPQACCTRDQCGRPHNDQQMWLFDQLAAGSVHISHAWTGECIPHWTHWYALQPHTLQLVWDGCTDIPAEIPLFTHMKNVLSTVLVALNQPESCVLARSHSLQPVDSPLGIRKMLSVSPSWGYQFIVTLRRALLRWLSVRFCTLSSMCTLLRRYGNPIRSRVMYVRRLRMHSVRSQLCGSLAHADYSRYTR